MFVAACMSRLAKSIARNGPHANAPSLSASAVPKSTGTADAVKEQGRASRNHSLKIEPPGFVAFIGPSARDGLRVRTPYRDAPAPHLVLRPRTWLLSSRTTRVILLALAGFCNIAVSQAGRASPHRNDNVSLCHNGTGSIFC